MPVDRTISRQPTASRQRVSSFESEVTHALTTVRAAFQALLKCAESPIERPSQLGEWLDLDKALAWSVFRAAAASGPLDAAPYVPRPGSMNRCIRAARRLGVPERVINEVEDSLAILEAVIERHAPSRDDFLTMLGEFTPERQGESDLKQKRAAFRANSHIQGSRVALLTSVTAVRRSAASPGLDVATLRGMQGLCRLRKSAYAGIRFRYGRPLNLPIESAKEGHPDNGPILASRVGPNEAGTVLLEPYCTHPLPRLSVDSDSSHAVIDIQTSDVGLGGAADFAVAMLQRDVQEGDAMTEPLRLSTHTWVPAEAWDYIVLVHYDLGQRTPTKPAWYHQHRRESTESSFPSKYRLNLQETVEELGEGINLLARDDARSARELTNALFTEVGWDPNEFATYYIRMNYPVLFATLGFELQPSASASLD